MISALSELLSGGWTLFGIGSAIAVAIGGLALVPAAQPFLDVTWRFLGTKAGQLALVAVVAFGSGVTLTTRHFWAKEARADLARKVAADAEHVRRKAVIEATYNEALAANQAIVALTSENERLLKESADASARNNDRPCLPSDAGVRLNGIGRPAH